MSWNPDDPKPGDYKRGVLTQPQREIGGRSRPRDPKKVKLEYRQFDDEEWITWLRYHTREDALKAKKGLLRTHLSHFNEHTQWRVGGEVVQ